MRKLNVLEFGLTHIPKEELTHHGILGMKWGVRRYQNADGSLKPAGKKKADRQLSAEKGVSSQTKKAINDHNSMSNKEFKSKYHVSKKTYGKRVDKYGDPYKNAPLAKIGKKLNKSARDKASAKEAKVQKKKDQKIAAIQKDIDSYNSIRGKGISTNKGKTLLSAKEVEDIVKNLEIMKQKVSETGKTSGNYEISGQKWKVH